MNPSRCLLPLLALGFLATAAASPPLDKATELWEQGRLRAAMIETKNALQQQPDDPAARILMARILLDLHEGRQAEAELRRLQDHGAAPETVLPLLGEALLHKRAYKRVLVEIQADSAQPPEMRA